MSAGRASLIQFAPHVWTLHLACGHRREFVDDDGSGAPLVTAICWTCKRRTAIIRRVRDGRETC